MRRFIIFLIVSILFLLNIFGITLSEIRDISKSDPDKAFTMLVEYLKKHPNDREAERLGKIISAKRVLMEITPIKDAVIKEDVYQLIDSMAKMNDISKEMMSYIEVIFPNFYNALREKVIKFDRNAFKVCHMLPERVREPKGFEKAVVDRYFEDPLHFDPRIIYQLKCMNLPRIKNKIKNYLETKMEEKNYVKIITLADMLMITLPQSTELHLYADILYKLNSQDALLMDENDFLNLIKEYEKLNLEKDLLSEKIRDLYLKLSQRLESLSCEDEKICPPVKRITEAATESVAEDTWISEATQSTIMEVTSAKKLPKFGFKIPVSDEEILNGDGLWIFLAFIGALVFITLVISLILIRLRDPKMNIKRLLKKIEKDPANPELHLKLAELYERIGRVEEAVKEYKLASKLFNLHDRPS